MKYEDFVDYLESVGYSDRYINVLLRVKKKLIEEYGKIPNKEEIRSRLWHATKEQRKRIMKFINLYEHFQEVAEVSEK